VTGRPSTAADVLTGFYSDAGDLAVEGTESGLQRLVRALRKGQGEVGLDIDATQDPSPYDGFLQRIAIESGPGNMVVSRRGTVLSLAGSADALVQLAANIEVLSNEGRGHLHEEYYPGHFYLAADSSPVVFEVVP
jgi:hypothetical protein